MKKNKNIGSSFESFLEQKELLEEVNAAAIKAALLLGKKIEITLTVDKPKK